MRIAGKAMTKAEVKQMSTPAMLRQLMFFAAAYDVKQTKAAEKSMTLLLGEISTRCRDGMLDIEIQEIIKNY